MGLSLDGLASGLDTTALIDALMDVHAIPRTLLQNKVADKNAIITQLQSLNSSLQQLATRAAEAAKGQALSAFTGTSSSSAATVQVRSGASPVSADIVVDAVARAHSVVTAAASEWPDAPPVLTILDAEGQSVEITADSTSFGDVARAINAAGAGVTAAVVSAGTNATGTPLQRLQLTATETGASGAFQVLRGDAAAVAAGTAADIADAPGAAVVTTGVDAQVRLWAGTDAEQVLTSASNTFTDLFPGVDVTVSGASADPVSIDVAVDAAARTASASAFVKQIAAILTGIDNGSKATVATSGDAATTLGVFTGDSTVRSLRQALAQAVQAPIDGVSPSSIGISIDRYGALGFDEEKFAAALADDPEAVAAMFSGIAERVSTTATTYSDRYDGMLTARITGQENEVDSLGDQIERWDTRLAQRRATLASTYTRLETMLSQLQSQSAYLTSQLSSLPTYSTD